MNKFKKIIYCTARKFCPIILHKYHYSYNKVLKTQEPTLIIANHLTDVDSLMLSQSFPNPLSFVVGSHLMQTTIGKIMNKTLSVILMSRGNGNSSHIREIIEKLKTEDVVLYPEGCRSFNGETLTIPSSIAKLVKIANCQVVTFRFKGGYFVSPRWAYTARKGKVSGEIVNIYSKKDIKEMETLELTKRINEDIYENAYERQRVEQNEYKGKRLAEGIENYLEVCPKCESVDSILSQGDEFYCTKCDLRGKYSINGFLLNVPFDSTLEWGKWQDEKLYEICKKDGLLFTAKTKEYIVENNNPIYKGEATLNAYKDRMDLDGLTIPYTDIASYSLLYYGRSLLFTYNGIYYKLTDFLAYKFCKLIDFHKNDNDSKTNK